MDMTEAHKIFTAGCGKVNFYYNTRKTPAQGMTECYQDGAP